MLFFFFLCVLNSFIAHCLLYVCVFVCLSLYNNFTSFSSLLFLFMFCVYVFFFCSISFSFSLLWMTVFPIFSLLLFFFFHFIFTFCTVALQQFCLCVCVCVVSGCSTILANRCTTQYGVFVYVFVCNSICLSASTTEIIGQS